MPTEDAKLVAQPSFKYYVWSWLIVLIVVALGVVLAMHQKWVVDKVLGQTHKDKMLYVWLAWVAVLVLPLLRLLWKRASVAIRVFDDRVVIERGILAKNMKELFITDIRTIDITQTFFQRIMGIGELAISTPGMKMRDVLHGFPDPARIKETIIKLRQAKQAEAKPAKPKEPEPPPEPQPKPQE